MSGKRNGLTRRERPSKGFVRRVVDIIRTVAWQSAKLAGIASLAIASVVFAFQLHQWPHVVAQYVPIWLLVLGLGVISAALMACPFSLPRRWQLPGLLACSSLLLVILWTYAFHSAAPIPVTVEPHSNFYVFDDIHEHYVPVQKDSFDAWAGRKTVALSENDQSSLNAPAKPQHTSLEAPRLDILEYVIAFGGSVDLPPDPAVDEVTFSSPYEAFRFAIVDVPAKFSALFFVPCLLSLFFVSEQIKRCGQFTALLILAHVALVLALGQLIVLHQFPRESLPSDVFSTAAILTGWTLICAAYLLIATETDDLQTLRVRWVCKWIVKFAFAFFLLIVLVHLFNDMADQKGLPGLRMFTVHPSHGVAPSEPPEGKEQTQVRPPTPMRNAIDAGVSAPEKVLSE